jgi:hypothetical protein
VARSGPLASVRDLGAPTRRSYADAAARVPPVAVSVADAVAHTVRRYLGGFGPATAADAARWAGLRVADVSAALRRMELFRYLGPDGETLHDVPDGHLPDGETPAPVRLLPVWDATLLAHARRAGVLPEQYRPLIFTSSNPQSTPAFLVDGVVAGVWRHDGDRIVLEPWRPLDAATRRALDDEAERLADLYREPERDRGLGDSPPRLPTTR